MKTYIKGFTLLVLLFFTPHSQAQLPDCTDYDSQVTLKTPYGWNEIANIQSEVSFSDRETLDNYYINDPDYADADPDCVTCHQTDFDNTNDPNHSATQFPTDCVQCHTTNPGWTPTTWDHDDQYFPVYSGKHDNEWNECIDCHTNSNDYTVFNCLNCHEHNDQNQVDNDHDHPDQPEFDGYVYESNACYTCHPNP